MIVENINKSLKYRLSFCIGDPSEDGHGKKRNYYINCNYSSEEIDKIYKQLTDKLGFDFCKEAASEYESQELAPEFTEKLIEIEFLDKDDEGIVPEGDRWYTPGSYHFEKIDEFLLMFFNLLQMIQPDLDYEFVQLDWGNLVRPLNGAGYGFFY